MQASEAAIEEARQNGEDDSLERAINHLPVLIADAITEVNT